MISSPKSGVHLARSDIFALGAVFYEMATGERAFTGKSNASIVAAILAADPQPVSAVRPTSPLALDRVVRACLAKDPDERVQTAHDVKLQLKWIVKGDVAPGLQSAIRPRARLAWLIVAITSLIAVVFAAFYLQLALRHLPVVRSFILPPSGTSFEQWLHGHGLVEVVFGLGDLFTSDQKPHIGVHQVLRSSPASRVELSQREVRRRRALLGSNVRVRVWSYRAQIPLCRRSNFASSL